MVHTPADATCHYSDELWQVWTGDRARVTLRNRKAKGDATVYIDNGLALFLCALLCTEGADYFRFKCAEIVVDAGEAFLHYQRGMVPGSLPYAYGAP
jgi:hypothetical protein